MWVRFQKRVRAWVNATEDASINAKTRKARRRMDYPRALRYRMARLSPFGEWRKRQRKLDRPPPCGTICPHREQPRADASGHERASPRTRVPKRPFTAAALADVHRRLRFRLRPAVALWLVPPDAGERQD